MGLFDSEYRPTFVPEDERTSEIELELRDEFHALLSNGGIITRSGNILPIQLEELLPSLPSELQKKLDVMPVQRVTFSKIRAAVGDNLNIDQVASNRINYLFNKNAIRRLSYKEYRRGSIMPVIIGYDGSYTPPYQGRQFPNGFAQRVKCVLHHEGYPGSHFRFMSEVLKEFANNEGLGNLEGPDARQAIEHGRKMAEEPLLF